MTPSWRSQKPRAACDAIERAADANHITPQMVMKGPQHAAVVRARRQAISALRVLGYSTPLIGRMLGGLHHTTVLYHLQKAPDLPREPFDAGAPDESGVWA